MVVSIAIVNVALPSIKIDLGFSQENLHSVISAYVLFFGGFLPLGGRQVTSSDDAGLPDCSRPLHDRLARLRASPGAQGL